jgi:SNF2 family DNA or RNA helicase
MLQLKEIKDGQKIAGILDMPVTILNVKDYGSSIIITYRDNNNNLGEQLLYKEAESNLTLVSKGLNFSFDADADNFKLVSEATRINNSTLFDPFIAVNISDVQPLPHQISAVYETMLPQLPLRFCLADDPGAGKTIMTGLLIRELLLRGDLKRCLIVTPGSLVNQWQDELHQKFSLNFEILTNDRLESAVTGNPFLDMNLCIARMDKLSRDETAAAKLNISDWDLIVVDEAHKMSATYRGDEQIEYTKRYRLGQQLSGICRNFLLLTATPHSGKDENFQLFLSLLDEDRFIGFRAKKYQPDDLDGIMHRLLKEDLLKFDGRPLFPERKAYTVSYRLSSKEADLYEQVTAYVRGEFTKADSLTDKRKNTIGFALTILQRRLASSPEAIYRSLKRRLEKLQKLHNEETQQRKMEQLFQNQSIEEFDPEDMSAFEFEKLEEKITGLASASESAAELAAEIEKLKILVELADEVLNIGQDCKWVELANLLQDNPLICSDDEEHKIIIFTEHRDTLSYLTKKIRTLLGREENVVNIHGGMNRNDRRKVEEHFKFDKDVHILVATDAAGEGINLQRSHLMINYDLPWNPNRLEQRFGRIHRIGQTEVCHLWNLVATETREGMVFNTLLSKIEKEREALGGKVFDILGKLEFGNKSLKELLIDAVRYGNEESVRNRLNEIVNKATDHEALVKLIEERSLTQEVMDWAAVQKISEEMDRIEARKLQPHFIEAFFLAIFKKLGGTINERGKGFYEIKYVPSAIRNQTQVLGTGEVILKRYERVCFEKKLRQVPGLPMAAFICPGHPLLAATISLLKEKSQGILKQGTILVDDNDHSQIPRLLLYLESSLQDATVRKNGEKRIISKRFNFVEIYSNGDVKNSGYAPYLDYRAPRNEELGLILNHVKIEEIFPQEIESVGINFAIEKILPEHLKEVKDRKIKIIEKTAKSVYERLTREINHWDFRAAELETKEKSNKSNAKLNSEIAKGRADDLEDRLKRRTAELEKEKIISPLPPVIVGCALVIPAGLVNKLTGNQLSEDSVDFGGMDKNKVEMAAMMAVMEIERRLNFQPTDVSQHSLGYDIESKIPEHLRTGDSTLRFIEVKGRVKGADTVTVTKNEILAALNKPDDFILALVEVDEEKTNTCYLKKPFRNQPEFSTASVNFFIKKIKESAEILLEDSQ